MSYTINEILIRNFKSIDEAHLKNLNNSLTVLDGPNGFGKTSVFDAIELALTGSIRRIKEIKVSKGNFGYRDQLIAKDQSKPVIIKLELQKRDSDSKIIFARKINVKKLKNSEKKPGVFISSLHNISNMSEELNENNKVNENDDIKLKVLKESFKFFNYIEQENNSHFFKEEEEVRMAEISKLFNIEKESTELNKLKRIQSRLSPQLRTREANLEELKKQMNLDNHDKNNEIKVEYQQILPENLRNKELWDQEVITNFTLEKKHKLYSRIDSFKYLLKNFSQFESFSQNESIRALRNKPDRIKNLLVLGKLIEKKEEIIKENDLKIKLRDLKKIISERLFLEKEIDFELIYKHFDISIEKEELIHKIENTKELNQSNDQVSKAITSLMSLRERLISDFKNVEGEEQKKCPLCGHEHNSYNDLIEEFDKHAMSLKNALDSSSKLLMTAIEELFQNVFTDLIIEIDKIVDSLITDKNYNVFIQAVQEKMNVKKALEFFCKVDIDIELFLYDTTNDYSDLEIRTERIRDLLEKRIDNNVLFDLDYYNEAKDIFENTLGKNKELILMIDITLLEMKKNYLNHLYVLHMDELSKKYIKMTNDIDKIRDYLTSLGNTIDIYENEIQNYRTSMIREIEIPFYLYTGKIIQNYQRGIGVFIKEDRTNKNSKNKIIRFVPHNETDHDVVHSFSSGQLSATVIAFTLAINKVFSSEHLNTILIDDPVQTMDDINMASFIELLRSDFGNTQIILSTHSNSISLYMRYKFSKYGFKTQNINVKEELG